MMIERRSDIESIDPMRCPGLALVWRLETNDLDARWRNRRVGERVGAIEGLPGRYMRGEGGASK
jgi:hypothetical protein